MALAESILIANAVTQGFANTNVMEFVTGVVDGQYKPGTDGSRVLTIPELLGAGPGGVGGNYSSAYAAKGGLIPVLKDNLKDNGAIMAAQVIGIPIAFKVAGSLLKKPRRQVNSIMKQIGLDGVKV